MKILDQAVSADSVRARGMFFLQLAVAAIGFALFVQLALNANFIGGKDEINATASQMGYIEAARETCGILAFLILGAVAGIAEPLVASVALFFVGLGLASYAFVPKNYLWVLGLSLIWSQGLHVWFPLPNSMCMAIAEEGKTGYRLGQLSAAGSAGSFFGVLTALLMVLFGIEMRPIYLVAGLVAVLGAIACLGVPRKSRLPGPRLIIRKRYSLYYLLCLLEGWRKQIFVCFAAFMLVTMYGTSLRTMLILWGLIQVIAYFISPSVGRLIDRLGERKVLTAYYLVMCVVFAGYAYIPGWETTSPSLLWIVQNKYILLYVLFVADSVFFSLAMALTTYVNRIAPQEEHTSTLSMGVAMNHVSAVTMPLVGGLLWTNFGPKYTFLAGSVAVLGSIVASLFLPARGIKIAYEEDERVQASMPVEREI